MADETDVRDRSSKGIYKENLKRMAGKKGTDKANIDSSLTYNENKEALGLKSEQEESRGVGVYERNAELEERWKKAQEEKEAEPARPFTSETFGIEGVKYEKPKRELTTQEKIIGVAGAAGRFASNTAHSAERFAIGAEQKITPAAKAAYTAFHKRNESTRQGRSPRERMFGEGRAPRDSNQLGGFGELVKASERRSGSQDPLISLLTGSGGQGAKKPRQKYAVIVEGNRVVRTPIQDMGTQQQQDPLIALLLGSGQQGNSLQTLTSRGEPRGQRGSQGNDLMSLVGGGGSSNLERLMGRGESNASLLIGGGHNSISKLVSKGSGIMNLFKKKKRGR